MKLQRRGQDGWRIAPRGRRDREDEGLIPLINVVFLILIFFMIAGRMETPAPLRVDPPASNSAATPVQPRLTLLLAADGKIAVGDLVMDPERLPGWLAQELPLSAAATASNPLAPVTLKADADVHANQLKSVLNTLRESGLRSVTLLTHRRP